MSLFEFARLIYRNAFKIGIYSIILVLTVMVLTLNQSKEYVSSALIYTGIASGYTIERSSDKVDYHAVNNAFDNLISIVKSRQTTEEVSIRLISRLLASPHAISGSSAELLENAFPSDLVRAKWGSGVPADSIYRSLHRAYHRGESWVVEPVQKSHAFFGIKILNQMEAKRHKSSDMLILYYKSEDPMITKLTLDILIDVFTERYSLMKEAETGDVVAYFERELEKARTQLDAAERQLTVFRSTNQVINYGEQTKAIAIKKQNALEEYAQRKMNLLATEAALLELEAKMKLREALIAKNSQLIDQRNELANLTQRLARTEAGGNPADTLSVQKLKSMIVVVKKDIEKSLHDIYASSNSKEGLHNERLINEWLEHVIALNREKAIVMYYQNRLDEIHDMYERFAPLGSTLARLEREIGVYERAYLEILNSLNESKLRQQNIQMISKLEVVDHPILPISPLPSKRMLLLIAAVLFGIGSAVSFLVLTYMLDETLRDPQRAAHKTSLKVIGAIPAVAQVRGLNIDDLLHRLSNLMLSKISHSGKIPRRILFISESNGDGKHFVASQLQRSLTKSGIHSALCEVTPLTNELTTSEKNQATQNDAIELIIAPPLIERYVPGHLIDSCDEVLFVGRADKVWSSIQSDMLRDWMESTGRRPVLILNGVPHYYLDQIIGDVPVQRNAFISLGRKLLRFEFAKSSFNLF